MSRKKKTRIATGVKLITKIECDREYFRIPPRGVGRHYIRIINRRPEEIEVKIESKCDPPGPLRYQELTADTWPQTFILGPADWRGFMVGDPDPAEEDITNTDSGHAPGGSQEVAIEVRSIEGANWHPKLPPPYRITVRTRGA